MTIHEWIIANLGSENDPAVQQAMFIRDRIGKALFPTVYPRDVPIEVVGEHHSKSMVLPVCLAKIESRRGAGEVRFRHNWYNWAISVQADRAIDDVGGWGLFDEKCAMYLNPSTMDGFEDAHVFGPYTADRRRFSCHIWGPDEVFWMFCRLLRGK